MLETTAPNNATRLNHSAFWGLLHLGKTLAEESSNVFDVVVATNDSGFSQKTLQRYMTDGVFSDDSLEGHVLVHGGESLVKLVSTSNLIFAVEYCVQSLHESGLIDDVAGFPLGMDATAALTILEQQGMVHRFRQEMGVIEHPCGRFIVEASGETLLFKMVRGYTAQESRKKRQTWLPAMDLITTDRSDSDFLNQYGLH